VTTPLPENPLAGFSRPTILQVIPSLETGGAERTTIDMARAIIAAGGRALVASRGGRMVRELEALGGEHVEMPVHSKNPIVMGLNVEHLTRLIIREKVDLVHARSRAPGWSALAAARRTQRPFVTTYHAKVHEKPRLKVFYNSVLARGDAVIANSAFTAARIARIHAPDASRIFTVPRGIDMQTFDPRRLDPEHVADLRAQWGTGDRQATVFLLPARLTRWKGQMQAIEAARQMLASHVEDEFLLLLVGDAQGRKDYLTELHAAIAKGGLANHVFLPGHCNDMAAAYALADIVLSPAIEPEPFGRVAVEAQAMQRPVIVSDAGAARETVLSMENVGADLATGLSVPAGNASALAKAMMTVMELGEAARHEMGARGRHHVAAHFSLGAMCHATLEIYARLLKPVPHQA